MLPLRRRGYLELHQGFRLLVGQPQDQVVPVGTVGQRILLVFRKGLHLRRGPDCDFTGLDGLALPIQAHRPVECCNARDEGILRASLGGGEQRLNGGGVVAAAVFGHAEGQQVPVPPLPTLTELGRLATEGQCRFELRLVGGCPDTTRLRRVVGRTRIVGALGEREDPLPRGGKFLVLSEPRLESSDLQGSYRVFGIGGRRRRQERNRLARAAAGHVCVRQFKRRGDGGRVVGAKGFHFVLAGLLQQLDRR